MLAEYSGRASQDKLVGPGFAGDDHRRSRKGDVALERRCDYQDLRAVKVLNEQYVKAIKQVTTAG